MAIGRSAARLLLSKFLVAVNVGLQMLQRRVRGRVAERPPECEQILRVESFFVLGELSRESGDARILIDPFVDVGLGDRWGRCFRCGLCGSPLRLEPGLRLSFLRLDLEEVLPDVRQVFQRNLLPERDRFAVIRPDRFGKLPQVFPSLLEHFFVVAP